MILQDFSKLSNTDFSITAVTAVCPRWHSQSQYDRLEIPRHKSGLLFLTDHSALFQLPEGETLQAVAGDVIYLPKGARYHVRFQLPQGETTGSLGINFHLLDETGGIFPTEGKVQKLCRDQGELQPLFHSAVHHYENGETLLLKAAVYTLMDRLLSACEEDECAIGYINRHYTEKFDVPTLAKRCAMSETTYRKRFKALTGQAPVQYINGLKIRKACGMILDDDMRLEDICNILQFYSLPYFYKVFKDHTGLTPVQYKEQNG